MIRWLLAILLLAAPVSAQVRPGAFTTVTTTDTTANSLLVGCAVGSTTCTGGIKSGPISGSTGTFSGNVTMSSSNSGATNSVSVLNTSNTASSNALLALSVAGTSAGDAYATFAVTGATTWAIGVDNSASDAFVLAASSGLGTTNVASWASSTGILTSGANIVVTAGTNAGLGFEAAQGGGASAFGKFDASADTASLSVRAYASGFNAFTHAAQALAGYTEVWGDTVSGAGTLGMLIGVSTNVPIKFATNNLYRWGINGAGDFTIGTSSKIALSNGVPNTSSCGGSSTIAGNDYAILQNKGSNNVASCSFSFGHTWSTAPICVASSATGNIVVTSIATTTTALILNFAATANLEAFQILCMGY
jgi:hypothetical protein